jgi:hypothetical protein
MAGQTAEDRDTKKFLESLQQWLVHQERAGKPMTEEDARRLERVELSEVEAARRLREGLGAGLGAGAGAAGALGAGAGVGARAGQGLLRRRQKPIDMRFTTTQPTVKGLEKDWDRLPATPNPRVSLRRKRKSLPAIGRAWKKTKYSKPLRESGKGVR